MDMETHGAGCREERERERRREDLLTAVGRRLMDDGDGGVNFEFKVILSRDASLLLKLHLIVLAWLE